MSKFRILAQLLVKYVSYALFFVFYFEIFSPAIDLENWEWYISTYYQLNFYSKHLEISKLLSYCGAVLIGLTFKHENLTDQNHAKQMTRRQLLYLSIASLLLFFISGNSALVGFYNYEGFCTGYYKDIVEEHKADGEIGYQMYLTMMDLKRVYTLKFMRNFFGISQFIGINAQVCVYPGIIERLLHRCFFLLIPLYLGMTLQNSFTVKIEWSELSFGKIIKSCYIQFQVKRLIFLIILSLHIILHFYAYLVIGITFRLMAYFFIYICLFAWILFNLYRFRYRKSLLVNHITISLLLIPLLNLNSIYDSILFSYCSGVIFSQASGFRTWVEKDSDCNIPIRKENGND